MNKSTGNFRKAQFQLTFEGGPLNGKTKPYPYLPEPRYGYRSKDTGEQFWYKVAEVNGGKVKMVLG